MHRRQLLEESSEVSGEGVCLEGGPRGNQEEPSAKPGKEESAGEGRKPLPQRREASGRRWGQGALEQPAGV